MWNAKNTMMVFCFLLSLLLTGCNAEKDTAEKDLQRLSMIEVYSNDGELVNVIEDTEILDRFSDLDYTDIPTDADFSQTGLENAAEDLSVLYTIISYKSSVAIHGGGTSEQLMETIIYENSNIMKEQVNPDTIKGAAIPEEYLTFYVSVSEEKEFLLSLAEFHD